MWCHLPQLCHTDAVIQYIFRRPTDSTQERGDGGPDADTAHAEPLTDGQLQVEQWKALKYQGYQVGDEECTWVGGRQQSLDVSQECRNNKRLCP